jgi:hypothetical protein
VATRWEASIPRAKALSRAEIGQFLAPARGVLGIDIGVGGALNDLVGWASATLSQGCEDALERMIGKTSATADPTDAVAAIGKELSQRLQGIKGRIFRKSLEEALFEAAGFDDELNGFDLVGGLCKFCDRHGIKGFIELFLSLYVFNTVWIEIQDSVRLRARDTRSFEASLKAVERVCLSLVRSELREWEKKGKLDQLGHVRELGDAIMRALEDRLLELAQQSPIRR